jgi:hypothetical protein
MALRRKPHALTVYPVDNTKTGPRVDAPSEDTAYTLHGQITPMSSEQVYQAFGIELKRPHLLLLDEADGRSLKVGWRIVFDSRTFNVSSPPMVWNAGLTTNCCQIALEQVQNP